MSGHQHTKHYTLKEARELMAWIRGRVKVVQQLLEELENRGFDVVNGKWTPRGNGHSTGPPPEEYRNFLELIAELDSKSIFVKNFVKGIVNIPHVMSDGEEVYLCWLVDELTIAYWHRINDRFSDRMPYPEIREK